jgi:hypothetical protein
MALPAQSVPSVQSGVSDDSSRYARKLRVARDLVERFAPQGPERDEVLFRLDRWVAALERRDGVGACRRCGETFTYDPYWITKQGLKPPRHCIPCRRIRCEEAQRAVPAPVAREKL